MTTKYTNNTGISLSMAVWLANDLYDHNKDDKTISVTKLIKPIKQTILSARVPEADTIPDVSTLIKAQAGTAVHTAVEVAWLENYRGAMAALGYPDSVIERVRINPTKSELEEMDGNVLPVYMEVRSEKEIKGMKVSGKFDFVSEGNLEDIKNTSTYTYIKKSNDEAYKLQGSIYRWLNQDIITGDHITIQYIFSDWNAMSAQRDSKYPPHAQMSYKVPLMSVSETEAYIGSRITILQNLWDAEEAAIPPCSKAELWQDDAVWKYYKNPAKMTRSTKNFANAYEASVMLGQNGGVGVVVEVPGQVRACKYCNAFSICKQKDSYILSGSLKV